jgi:DNA-binding NtrC family response regulator
MAHRVLVIDADPAGLAETAQILSDGDYLVTAVSEYDVAKQQLRLAPPDVLVVDVRLGQYNGLQLVLRARRDRPDMAVVLTHGVLDPVLEEEAKKAGAAYVVKPIDAGLLLEIVQALRQRPAIQPQDVPDSAWP